MSDKRWKAIKVILLLGSLLAAVKLVFVDYTLDEEYQIVMAYRHLQGDMLFREMWEPHRGGRGMYGTIKNEWKRRIRWAMI